MAASERVTVKSSKTGKSPEGNESGGAYAHELVAADPILSELLHYWRSKCGPRPMPRRNDIDPTEIPKVLPHIMLIERAEDHSFRFRLCGSAVVEAYGQELRGKSFDQAFSPARAALARRHCTMLCDGRRPLVTRNRYMNTRGTELIAVRLLLPLSADALSVDMILMGVRSHLQMKHGAPLGQALRPDKGFASLL